MYTQRLKTIERLYKNAEKTNKIFLEAQENIAKYNKQLEYIEGLGQSLRCLNALIAGQENEWQEDVRRRLELEIDEALKFVYPNDGYTVHLTSRVLRGSIHVEASVSSYFSGTITGAVEDGQGRLFQQVVSFAALVGVMRILGIDTVYEDEAFSGAAKRNIPKITALLKHYQDCGMNLIIIAQDTSIASGMEANVLLLERSLDNKTTISIPDGRGGEV